MTELWDVYDENRVKTGRLHRRGEELGIELDPAKGRLMYEHKRDSRAF